jgi:subtilase family serine protease
MSTLYGKPAWQSGTGVPADGKRDVPDVSLTAAGHDGYLIVQNGGLYVVGGTSAAAPSFAGIMSLVEQNSANRQGNANPVLYALASRQRAGGAAVFLTSRSATIACQGKPASTLQRDTIRRPV